MSYEYLRRHIQDVLFTTPTPFSDNGKDILHEEIVRIVHALVEAGGRSFIPCGNTGEFHSLTLRERKAVVATTVDAVGDDCAVIAGVGGNTKDAIDQISTYEALGVDGVMIHEPNHAYRHEQGLVKYYRKISESTDIGILLYKLSGDVTSEVLEQIASIENIVGVKFAVNDVEAFSKISTRLSDELVFCTGNAERHAPSFALEGAMGFTTGIGSFVPEMTLALQRALEQEDWERALEIRDLLRPLEDIRDESGSDNQISSANNVPVVKYGLELAGLYGGPVREPIVDLTEEDKSRVERHYQRVSERISGTRFDE